MKSLPHLLTHGYGLRATEAPVMRWPDLARAWLKAMRFSALPATGGSKP